MPLYDRWTFETALGPQAIAQRLNDNIQTNRPFMQELKAAFAPAQERKLFRGEADLQGFKIFRYITYRNSFIPIITGRVEPALAGSRVSLTMRVALPSLIFFLIWVGFIASLLSGFLLRHVYSGALAATGMLCFAAILGVGCFEPERRKARRLLRDLLQPL